MKTCSIVLTIVLISTGSVFAAPEKAKNKTIHGVIKMSPELQPKISPDAAIYVIARSADKLSGPPVAVTRISQPLKFPISFTLTQKDVMIAGTPFEGEFTLSARLAQSGMAIPLSAGDIEASQAPLQVEVGAKVTELVLDKVRK